MAHSTLNFGVGNRKAGRMLEGWVLKGRKTSTTQVHRYGKKGDTFLIQGVKFKITSVKRTTLRHSFSTNYRKEGCSSAAGFKRIWLKFHKYQDKWPLSTKVYIYDFKRA